MLRNIHALRVATILVGMGTWLPAADFVAPAEGPIAFRRDKIPLDADTMASLSKQLETLAAAMDSSTAAGRRGVAQMLALATALDPSNTSARELIAGFQNNIQPTPENPDQVAKCQAKIWQYLGWLETPEAGDQGKALAACLADVIAVSEPKHPRSQALLAAGERGAWAGWIPSVSAYEAKSLAKIDEPVPATDPSAIKTPEITLTKAEVFTPLWQKTGKDEAAKWIIAPSPLQMAAQKIPDEAGKPAEFSITIRSAPDVGGMQAIANSLRNLLKKQYGKLPPGWSVVITSEHLQKSTLAGKRQSISAAAAVLASAAITGREPDATIIGLVDENGAFKLPTGFWDQLVALEKGNGGRLVLPAAAAEYLPSLLALEKPQFFLDYEVVLASNFQELLELSAKIPNDAIGKTSAKFQEIRSKAGSQPVGQYVANSFIRRRLADLAQEAPYHYSARMLAIQGAGNRPTQVPKPVLLPELRRAIAPMEWIVKPSDQLNLSITSAKIDQLTQTYETCRVQVDHLERYVEKGDHDLFVRVKEMVAAIRPLERAARARGEDYTIRESVDTARTALLRLYQAVADELVETGDKEPAAGP